MISFVHCMAFLFIIIALFLLYSFFVLYYWWSWNTIAPYIPTLQDPRVKISVIIPARNEENNIGNLLEALQNQMYSKDLYEVIVIDDHSTDNTATIVKQFSFVQLIQLKEEKINSYKKKAIETGIAAANGDLIVTTDADCLPTSDWLRTIAGFKEEKKAVFIAAPVVTDCNPSLVQVFQAMDFMVLQGITGAVVDKRQLSMCNGANLAYDRKAFFEVNGFSGIDDIASGDDMLLMYKISKKYPDGIHYLKSDQAMVSTQAVKSWKEFFHQRIRWASKAMKYEDKRLLPVLLIVFLFNLSFLVLLIVSLWKPVGLWLVGLWIAKALVELPLFVSVAKFFNKQWAIKWFFLFQPLHILYTVVSGLFGQFGKYEWKGRKVR